MRTEDGAEQGRMPSDVTKNNFSSATFPLMNQIFQNAYTKGNEIKMHEKFQSLFPFIGSLIFFFLIYKCSSFPPM